MEKSLGKYLIKKELGKGAMGVVYLGYDAALDRPVAIKTIASTMHEEELRTRFIREAQSTGKLRHNNIVTIYDFGLENEQMYLVMEYLEGQDLESLIASKRVMDIRERLEIIRQLCLGLEYAHENGIFHRDIKPANIRILNDGTVKIVDFGLASMQASTLTQSNAVLGTPHYMAPERIQGEKADARSDQFSVGLILYELLSYHRPFTGDSISSIIFKILNQQPKRLDMSNLSEYPELETIIQTAIAKKPSNRYPSLKEMIGDIEALQQKMVRDSFHFTGPVPMLEEPMFLADETSVLPTGSSRSLHKKGTHTFSNLLLWILPFVGLLIVIYIAFFSQGPKTHISTIPGYLSFDVKPFATIVKLTDTNTHTPVKLNPDSLTTPLRLTLPPGRYTIEYSNPGWGGKNRTSSFTIKTGETFLLRDISSPEFKRNAIEYFSIK